MANVNTTPLLPKGYNTAILTKADVTNGTGTVAWTTANTGLTLFTVTGAVLARVYGVATTLITSTGGTGTLAVGITASTGAFLAATTANGTTQFIANSIWVDTTPTLLTKPFVGANITWSPISNANILLAIVTNNMTAGGMTLYCDWVPMSAGATVV